MPIPSSAIDTAVRTTLAVVRVRSRSGLLAALGLAAGTLLLLCFSFQVFAFTHNGPFITFRYADNLRHGLGPVFNAGDRVEGYSCPLYLALTTLLLFLPGDVLFRAKALGVLFAVGAIGAVWRLAARLHLPGWALAAVTLLIGANAKVALSAIDGMETTFQMLLVTLAALAFVRERQTGRGWSSALWLLAAALNRPEGPVFFLAALPAFVLSVRQRGWQRRDALWLAAFIVPMTLFLLWRKAYYGDWLPNTYYAKQVPLDLALERRFGPAYLLQTLFFPTDVHGGTLLLSGLLWLGALGGAFSPRLARSGAQVVPLFVLAQAVTALCAGGDVMPGWRFMMPVVPLWTLLLVVALHEVAAAAAAGSERLAAALAAAKDAPLCEKIVGEIVAAVGVAALLGLTLHAAPRLLTVEGGHHSLADRGWATDLRGLLQGSSMENGILIADFLDRTMPAGATLAYFDIGVTCYLTPQLRYLDTYGLTDRAVAHLAPLSKGYVGPPPDYTDLYTDIGQHLRARRPDYILAWQPASAPARRILGGDYLPAAQCPIRPEPGRPPTVLQVWKRAE
ncbi:MAG TPA: hypothetical protein VFB21_24490 [Chthonomonadaceae bacterium]|nr:hypothetical protein [Chthonomonadaceae bacterium]